MEVVLLIWISKCRCGLEPSAFPLSPDVPDDVTRRDSPVDPEGVHVCADVAVAVVTIEPVLLSADGPTMW